MKRFSKFVLTLTLLICIWGCQATPYQKLGTTSAGGYSDKRISDDIFYVRFPANNYTPSEVICRYLYRHAAEVTLENGFLYFTVIRGPDQLTERREFYPSEDYFNDMEPPLEADVPVSHWLKMTIRCFENVPDKRDMRIIDAREYLKKHDETKAE
jgi:hypothetical protein